MTTNIPRQTIRVLSSRARSSLRPSSLSSSQRAFSVSASCAGEKNHEYVDKPRWSYTPPGMKAPFSLRQIDSKRQPYQVNEDPAVLDRFYISLLGPGGDKKLSEEIKWLAVTHKSFDQGRRGFNDRLALLGKRIVQLQASLNLVQNPENYKTNVPPLSRADKGKVFNHPALEGLENLTLDNRGWFTHKINLAKIAEKYELLKVLRWAPVKVS
ncbi:RNase III domain protein [Talaromyces stipitatus ATCC 10500]|uniref:RNase III domain protein n=1 Tax=Talaromyces stipitatus (strain ATCC 10500 / CBS 375.48 / QM 6759 / NRRL 1006) TaxID=441959 RepID=B8M9P2_TALSN|nr:RNase III domain protein [Talaromyces stipitatus ATCC 10500]EED18045.1 RNase III domain protein [Talaromyces stipitatus ATCC 10500]